MSVNTPHRKSTTRRRLLIAGTAVVAIVGVAGVVVAVATDSDDEGPSPAATPTAASAAVPVDLCESIPPPALRESFTGVELRTTTSKAGVEGYTEPGTRICTVASSDGSTSVTFTAAPYAGTVADYHAQHRQTTITTLRSSLEDADFIEKNATGYATSGGVLYSVHIDRFARLNAPITDVTSRLLEEWVGD